LSRNYLLVGFFRVHRDFFCNS
jgi:hypothetical protein